MTFPAFLLGSLIAMIIGCGFHFWRGGNLKWLITFNIFAVIGFWIGHGLGKLFEINFLQVGPIKLGPAIAAAVLFLFVGYWLSMASVDSDSTEHSKTRSKNG